MSVVFVFAENHRQAEYWAKQHGLREWRYLIDARSLVGVRSPVVLRCGTWYHRSDAGHIQDEMEARGAIEFHPAEEPQ